MCKRALFTALFLVLASLYFLYVAASFMVAPSEIIRPLIVLWLVLILLFMPAYWVTRDWNWAGLLLVVIVLGLFSIGIFAFAYSLAVVLILVLLWVAYRLLLRKRLGMRHVYIVLNTVSLTAIALSSTVLIPRLGTIPTTYYQNTRDVVESKKYVEISQNQSPKPDIYYIILDGYGRADILEELYEFDNTEFINYLVGKRFIVPNRSRANYPKTALSVTSTLNMDYITGFAPELDNSILWWLMSPWLDHNLVRTSLERIGYTSVSASTDWSITDNPTTDYYLKSLPIILTEFDRYILGVTPLKTLQPLIQNLATAPTYDSYRRSQINNLDSLVRSSTIPGPKFVFGHVLLSHPPFVFTSDGSPINPQYAFSFNDGSDFPGSPEQYREQYTGQIKFLNSQLQPVIESILKNSEQPPIIILQADHGPGLFTDFASVNNTCLAGRFSTFSAYYLPGMDPEKIPADITQVNLFRIIFNEYFDTNLPVLENKQYYPRQAVGIYDLEDVTARVDDGENCNFK